jgi:hypothetical protein
VHGSVGCTSSGATIPGMKKLADDDLEDDGPDPTDIPTRDLNRQVRRLAEAVLLRAVLDSRLPAGCYQHDAVQFLYPESEDARRHLLRIAELAGLPPAWLNERLASSAGMPLPTIRKCTKCKTALPINDFAPRYEGDVARYCGRCRAITLFVPQRGGLASAAPCTMGMTVRQSHFSGGRLPEIRRRGYLWPSCLCV